MLKQSMPVFTPAENPVMWSNPPVKVFYKHVRDAWNDPKQQERV